ncbi:MAG TPA: PKD domain-containing protein [Edaphocola sp.]|nr:PKD domain-containing protein [Edaphocola sp.]
MIKNFTWRLSLYTAMTILGVFFASSAVQAQLSVDIGPTSGSSSYYYGPYYRSSSSSTFDYSRYAYLYTASELNIPPGAVITKVAWLKESGTISGNNTFQIWMENNNASSLSSETWSTLIGSATQVYTSTTQSFPAGNDSYEEFEFPTPFLYSGGSLEIITDHEMAGTPSGANEFYYETATDMAIGWAASTAPSASTTIGSSSLYNDHRPTIRITYRIPAGNNAGITELSSPVSFCPGPQDIKVKVVNNGINIIDSVKIGWELDGVAQPSYNLTQTLDTFGGSGLMEREVTLGNHIFTSAPVSFKAWTYLPNGVVDTANFNDTISLVLHSSMSGTYTIDAGSTASATNYQTIDSLITDLEQYGVCGPVTANVVAGSGPYIELVNIGNIAGASAVNTIRINGNGETVQYTNTSSGRQLLTLDGAKYVTIDSLKFKALATDYGWGALITNGSAYDSIMHCEFDLSSITATSSANSSGICFSASTTSALSSGTNGTHCYIGYNHLKGTTGSGGYYYGITIYGPSDSNIVEHNIVENFYYYGIYNYDATGTKLLYNDVNRAGKTSVTTFYGIYNSGVTPGTEIIGNRVHAPGGTNGGTSSCYAMYLLGDGEATDPVLIANNAVYDINQGGTVYSMYLSTSPYNLVYNNTVNLDQSLSSSSTNYGIYASGTNTGTEIKNNNISITAGGTGTKYGFYYSTTASIDDAQKNNFYVNSTQSGTQNYGYYSGAFTTQSAFQTANPTLEAGSPASDPQFANPANGDLTPQSTNLLGQGLNLTAFVPKDINGNPRPATPSIGAFEQPPTGSNNAGAVALISPMGNFCPGPQMVNITVYNAGVNNITSLQVNWSVNGVVQTPVTYNGTLVPLTSSTGQNSDTIALGNATFSDNIPTDIEVWLSLPNGVADTVTSNDSISGTFQAPQYTVSTVSDTLCAGNNITLKLSPNTGYTPGDLTWQSSGDGAIWTDITNSDTASYTDSTLISSIWYRVKVGSSSGSCYSDSLKVTVLNLNIDSVHNNERCGPGTVNLEAFGTPGGTISWYDDPLAATPIDTGSSYMPSLAATDTFYVSSALNSGSGGNGIRITEMNIGNTDGLEIQNVSGSPVDVTGWKVAISDNYSTVTTVNSIVQTLNGVLNPGDILSWTDASSASNYWGNNILWDPTGKGWALIIDANNNVVDFVSQDWAESTIQTTTLSISGASIDLNGSWIGSGLSGSAAGSSNSFQRTGSSDNDDASDFTIATPSIGTQNTNITLPFVGIGGGCESARQPVIATINPLPAVDLGDDTSICPGTSAITLDAGNQGTGYIWSTGASSQTITIDTGMTYSVTVTGANGCTASDTIIVQNGIYPIRVLPPMLSMCSGETDTLNAGNTGSSYIWNTGDNGQKLGVQASGNYKVSITSTTGCTIEDSSTVVVHDLPIVNLGNDTALCPGDSIILDAGNPGNIFQWNISANTQTISASDSGIYAVSVTNTYGCQQADSIHIATNPAPVSVLPDTTNWCTGTTPDLDAGNAGSTYAWNTGEITQTIAVNDSGSYTVTITNTYGCSITSATEVVVRQSPIVQLRTDTSICSGVSITLDAGTQPSGSSYAWNNGDTTQTTQAFGGGLYTVTVMNLYGCSTSDNVTIGLLPNPVVNGINEAQNPDGSFTFTASVLHNINSITGYEWDFGDGSPASTQEHPTHSYATNGVYTVRLIVYSICGSDTTYKDIQITVNGVGEISLDQAQLKLYPNPATDLITIKNESTLRMSSIEVYNVLGQKLLSRQLSSANTYMLHTQNLASGTYQIRIGFTNGHWLMRKFEIGK